ncbi:MAG TPA: alpha/beta fold hydrolase, partial [Sediminibacterium sp.]|nr:alpha/beta fold hydrolase [Sediminibacterium sp.]
RSCSGEMNRLLRFYHHGDAGDLQAVIRYSISRYAYQEIVLVGFSMGGSLSIRAVAADPASVPAAVKAVIAFSTPCNLESSVRQLMLPENRLYQSRFLRKLGEKIRAKAKMYPEQLRVEGYAQISNFFEFDDRYTAPLHGYKNAADFYARASVAPLLPAIKVPTLLVQARNDSFLKPDCYGLEAADSNPYLLVELPEYGGHCGFQMRGSRNTWAEKRAVDFAQHLR